MASQNTWPALLCIILIVRLAATSAFRFMDNVPYQSSRLKTIDGLRGFLALAVFFDHSFVYFGYVRSDKWDAPVGNVFSALGEAGVALFFMITGYLFWAHMLRERGKPDWLKLFVGRLFRIGPLYLVAIAVMFLLVLRDTGFRLNVAPTQLSGELFYWLGLGFFAPGPINGTEHPGLQLAGVTWSLRFEWLFYLSLPISAVAARRSRLQLVLVLSICVGLLLYVGATQRSASVASAACCALLFSFGMVCAGAAQLKLLPVVSDHIGSIVVASLLMVVIFLLRDATTALPVLVLGIAFAFVVSGASIFGILTSRPASRLGDMSYGIYLLHGLLLGAVFFAQNRETLAGLSPALHWVLVVVAGCLLLPVAAVSHVMIERPGINAGRYVVQRLRAARQASPIARASTPTLETDRSLALSGHALAPDP